jgi:hypothetical protein
MGLRLRDWFGSKAADAAAPSPIDRSTGRAPSDPPRPEPGSAAAELRSELEARIARLAEALGADARADAALALLSDLQGDIRTVVRRPSGAIQRALETCRDPDASLERIAATFARDPALAQALLKYANSSFYASAGIGCSSLVDATQRIGQSGTHSVLMASLVESLLTEAAGELGLMVQQVWTHLVRTAPLARRIGKLANLPPEQCYTAWPPARFRQADRPGSAGHPHGGRRAAGAGARRVSVARAPRSPWPARGPRRAQLGSG